MSQRSFSSFVPHAALALLGAVACSTPAQVDKTPPKVGGGSTAPAGSTVTVSAATRQMVTSTFYNVTPGGTERVRRDINGNQIDAHEGEIRFFGGTYYWYGDSYQCGWAWTRGIKPWCGYRVYTSPDMVNWTDHGLAFNPAMPLVDSPTHTWQDLCSSYGQTPQSDGCFRPHVVQNAQGQYVMWLNNNTRRSGIQNAVHSGYRVLVSNAPQGPFTEVAPPVLSPIFMSVTDTDAVGGDENLFVDDDGTAYLVFNTLDGKATNMYGFMSIYIHRLNSTFTSGDLSPGSYQLVASSNEAPAHGREADWLFKRNGLYYVGYQSNCGYCSGNGQNIFYKHSDTAWTTPLSGSWASLTATDISNTGIGGTSCGGQGSAVMTLGGDSILMIDTWRDQAPNEAYAGIHFEKLSFQGDAIAPITCMPSLTMTVPATTLLPKDLTVDQTTGQGDVADVQRDPHTYQNLAGCRAPGTPGFYATVVGTSAVEQTFIPAHTGALARLSVYVGQEDQDPNSSGARNSLQLALYAVDRNNAPTGAPLSSALVSTSSVQYNLSRASLVPASPAPVLQAGVPYAIVVSMLPGGAATSGCYVLGYSLDDAYPPGYSMVSTTGTTWSILNTAMDLAFDLALVPTEPSTSVTRQNPRVVNFSTNEQAGVPWSSAYINDGLHGGEQEDAGIAEFGWTSDRSTGTSGTCAEQESVQYVFAEPTSFNRIDLYPRVDSLLTVGYGFPIDFTIQVSDGVQSTTVVKQSAYAQPGFAVQSFVLPRQTVTSITLLATKLHSNPYDSALCRLQFAEIEVYDVAYTTEVFYQHNSADSALVGWDAAAWQANCPWANGMTGLSTDVTQTFSHAVECRPAAFAGAVSGGQAAVLTAPVATGTRLGDWDQGNDKLECPYNTYVSGVSQDKVSYALHAVQCSSGSFVNGGSNHCEVHEVRISNDRGSSSEGDWDPGYVEAECNANQFIFGVSREATSGRPSAILCCDP